MWPHYHSKTTQLASALSKDVFCWVWTLAAKVARDMGLAMQHSDICSSRRLGFRPKNELDKNVGKRLNKERVMQKRCSGHNTYSLAAMAGWAGLSPIGILFQCKTSPAELLKCVSLHSIDQFYSLKQHLLSQNTGAKMQYRASFTALQSSTWASFTRSRF